MSFCPQCGAPNPDDARFCEKCGGAVSPAQAPATAQPAEQVAEQAKAAVTSAAAAVKKIDPKLLIGAGVLLVILIVGVFFLRPMDKRDYKREAEDQVTEIQDDLQKVWSDMGELAYADADYEDDLDEDDVASLRDRYKEESGSIKSAAGAIKGLRPPSEYREADKDLRLWADYASGDLLKQMDDLIKQAEKGMTYEEFQEAYDDFQSDLTSDNDYEDAFEALYDASDELSIDAYVY